MLILSSALSLRANGIADSVLNRYKSILLKTEKYDVNIKQIADKLNAKGYWPDINYADQTRGSWQVKDHFTRIRKMALSWANPASPDYHQATLWTAIDRALNVWLEKRFQNPNWWHNEIGNPQTMGDIIILIRDKLSPDELKQSLEVMNQVKIKGTGANLTWTADIGLHYGALTGNSSKMDSCSKLLINEVKISSGEGMQPDYSFHQHSARLQSLHYGAAFLEDNTRLAWELRGTPWAYPHDKIKMLIDLILKGDQWMERGIAIAPGTNDRAISRPGTLHGGNLTQSINFLIDIEPSAAKSLKTVAARYVSNNKPLTGFRYFPYSDFAAYHTNTFSFFLKTISPRTLYAETNTNSENLKGRLLNGGDAYLISNGNEYFDMPPVWNWNYLPGITNFSNTTKVKQLPFNGSVTDSLSGLSAMDYAIADSNGKFTAHKIWAAHQNMVVCLIGGIKSTGTAVNNAFTALNQCRLQGKVEVNGVGKYIGDGDHHFDKVSWIYHSGFAYIPLKPSPFNIKTGNVTGSWHIINDGLSAKQITDKVFMPVMLHTNEQATGYVIMSCSNAANAQKAVAAPSWKIIQNDGNCQAVQFNDGMLMAAFFNSGSVKSGNISLKADKPCLIIKNANKLIISDPSHTGGSYHIEINNRQYAVQLQNDGSSNEIKL